ncbi:alpha-ketoglutarate decarboxylase [Aureisphaera galaxeae]|uniref:alpha-ketoglutarate decarboxylase n=1 Tax=Aureisphaera galaxeae TaxID=1538023 RepID=UPI00235098EF|nr:alpha-ketoglutarate decarboxylase [Aureisphaera galaxeae]MDC8005931.1 alpha-ketoglutarate decarboxylase [Aureisphaera galaxeae]
MKTSTLLRTCFCTILCLFLSISLQAQEEDYPSPFWSNVRFGGGIGLSFANGFFSATLAPSAIYEVNEQFALGVGLNGTYNSEKDFYRSTILGGSILTLYNVIPELQLSAEFEELNVNRNYEDDLGLQDENYWYPALFVGAGFRSNNFTFGIRYDVLYDEERSIYADPWAPFVRVFF